MNFKLLILAIISSILISCNASKPFYGRGESDWHQKQLPAIPVKYTVFLMGGFDYEKSTTNNSFELLRRNLDVNDTNHAVVYLNDRVYKKAKEDADDLEKNLRKKNLDTQLDFLKTDKGSLFFIAGHDKAKRKSKYKPGTVKEYVENRVGKKNIFYPLDGCPGPGMIELNNDLVLVPINTSYWIWDQKKTHKDCEVETNQEWLDEIKEVIDTNQRKNIIVLGHHPVINLGNHGGWFSLKQHIFPFTELNRNLYVPLPVVGTLYPILRIAAGLKNDRSYPPHNRMRKSLIRTFSPYPNVIYASGFEQNFQYFKYLKEDYIVTNSADEITWTGTFKSKFTNAASGITKITYLENGEVWMEFIVPDNEKEKGMIVYRKRLKDNVYNYPKDSTAIEPSQDVSDSVITVIANKDLNAGKLKTIVMGKHYRNAWAAPVTVPVIDLQTEQGGLEIIKKGGGNQTRSLQLKNKNGEEVTLRSVVKFPENLLGPLMTNTLAADIVKDQTSSIHPYTAFVIDNLSDVAGVLHSDPKIVYIPNDRDLQEYRRDFANTLAVFEKKAAGNIADADNFQNIDNAISFDKLMKLQRKDNNAVIDDYKLLRSRLFDMWINDWDRHQDQWRWGEVPCDGGHSDRCNLLKAHNHYFIPIPKDRDQAFARFDGIIPWIAGRKWTGVRFQHFTEEVKNVEGLNFNARNFDHAFLARMSREDWNRSAQELQKDLTDKKIEYAIKQFPDTIYKIDGPDMIHTLKSRRDNMPEFANKYYEFLSRIVDIRGSNENEVFEITRIDNDSTRVNMYDGEISTDKLLYSRTFLRNETKEVRIFAGDGNDIFRISGETERGLKLRIIGGGDKDSIVDNSFVRKGCKKTLIYDDLGKNIIFKGREARDLTSNDKEINDYTYNSHPYDLLAPATFFGFNKDDGLFIGGGVLIKKQGFRKAPYAYLQRLVGNISLKENSFNLVYLGDFINVFGKWGIHTDVNVLAPRSVTNFFGLGNETVRLNDDDAFYRLRYDNVYVYPGLKRKIWKHHTIKMGPVYEYIDVEKTPGRFISSLEGVPFLKQVSTKSLGGLKAEYEFQVVDDSVLTFRGLKWLVSGITQKSLTDSYATSNFESQLKIYIPIANRATLAIRFGGATRTGKFDFFQANSLGGYSLKRENGNLRGYLRGRYSGRSIAYMNTDVRVKLFVLRTYLFPSHFGINGFYDQGRVWTDNEKSSKLHSSYGGGIWFDPFAKTIVNLTYAVSKEDQLLTLAVGFLF